MENINKTNHMHIVNLSNDKIFVKLKKVVFFLYIFTLLFWDTTLPFKFSIVCLLLVAILLIACKKALIVSPFAISYGLFSLYFIIHTSLGLSVDDSLSWDYCATLAYNWVIIFAFSNLIVSKADIIMCFKCFIFSAIICMIYSIVVTKGDLDNTINYLFFTSVSFSHNTIPVCLAVAGGMIICLYKDGSLTSKIWLVFLPIFLVYIVFSGARKALILAVLLIILYPFILKQKRLRLSRLLLVFILLFFICLVAYFIIMKIPSLYNAIGIRFEGFLNGIFEGEYTESSAISRSIMLETALNLVKNNFMIGYGLFSFSTFPGSYGTWSHNNYLELIVSGGILCAVIYYSIHVVFVFKLAKMESDCYKRLFLIYILYVVFIHDLLSVSYLSRTLLLMFSFISAYIRIISNKSRENVVLQKLI